ncbi:MAG TPA: ABC transporter substrate-binding protein [Casimicrobiaceae bacterium]|nr:ABC transporter substrate-binding protein [Casimicrobiaceae bacterium]
MMKWLTRLALGLAPALLAMAVSAGVRAEGVTLDVFYAQPSFARFHDPIAQAFMKAHPDIKIVFRAPAADYDVGHQAMLREAVTNNLPDIYFPGFHLLAELTDVLVPRKQIVDLDPLLAAEPAGWRASNYADKILDLGKVHGKLYGLAVNASLPVMYFNADLVKKAGGDPAHMPDTWEGVIALAKKIHETSGLAGMAYNVHEWPDTWLFQAILTQEGVPMLDPTGTKIAFDNDKGVRALTLLRRFVTEGGMKLIGFDESRQSFVAGNIGIFFDTPARMKQVSDLVGTRFALGTAVFPLDDKAHGGIPTGGCAIVITARDPAKQKAAWEYAKFITGPEAQKIVVEATGYLPTNKRASGPDFLGPFYDKNPNFRTVALETDRAVPWQGYTGASTVQIWRKQREIISAVMRGDVAPADGLKRIASETAAMMKQ